VARGFLALLALETAWLVACEGLRERAPWALLVFLAGPWALLVACWWAALPRGPRATATLVVVLLLLDLAVDLWIPYLRRFFLMRWQLARALALLLGAWLATRGFAPAPAARALRVASLLAAFALFATMVHLARSGRRDETRPADAALVLGFALDAAGRPLPSLIARIDHGAALYRAGIVPRLVLTGGPGAAGMTEASVMRALALARGVPEAALLLEPRARRRARTSPSHAPCCARSERAGCWWSPSPSTCPARCSSREPPVSRPTPRPRSAPRGLAPAPPPTGSSARRRST
jgi:hypothetical protein